MLPFASCSLRAGAKRSLAQDVSAGCPATGMPTAEEKRGFCCHSWFMGHQAIHATTKHDFTKKLFVLSSVVCGQSFALPPQARWDAVLFSELGLSPRGNWRDLRARRKAGIYRP
jgi:hypothetical protein